VTTLKEGQQHLDEETLRRVMEVLVAPHKHKHRKLRKPHAHQGTFYTLSTDIVIVVSIPHRA